MSEPRLEDKVELVKKSKKNANYIIDFISELNSDEESARISAASACWEVFSHFFTDKEWLKAKERLRLAASNASAQTCSDASSLTADETFYEWIHKQYQRLLTESLEKLHAAEEEAKVHLKLLMDFLLLEYRTITKATNFPNQLFLKILRRSIEDAGSCPVDEISKKYFHYADIKFYTLKNIPQIIGDAHKSGTAKEISGNVYTLLSSIALPSSEVGQADMFINQANIDNLVVDTTFINKKFRAMCSKAWMSLLREPSVSSAIQTQILLDMDAKIIPNVSDPKLLIDYLTDSYNRGGASSLLALNSLFTLMHGYNLDYPDFYGKLYSLYQPSTFHVKYKSRLYHLSNMFFSSTHMPAYLVAAFVKRMGRLCLFAPVGDILVMLSLIKNMLIRYPSVGVLIHRNKPNMDRNNPNMDSNNPNTDAADDPYDFTEPDPAQCNAIASSLWELSILKSHHHSDVVKMVASFKKELGHTEEDITSHLDTSYEGIILDLLGRDLQSAKEVAINFEKPNSFFDESSFGMWSI